MTFDDDYVRLVFEPGRFRDYRCKILGIDWPPPERLVIAGFAFKRNRLSQIPDEVRESMSHVCRGAEYVAEEGNGA